MSAVYTSLKNSGISEHDKLDSEIQEDKEIFLDENTAKHSVGKREFRTEYVDGKKYVDVIDFLFDM